MTMQPMQPHAAMSLWAGLSTAQVFENGVYFGPGIFDVEIVRCLSKDTQKSGLAFIVETEVLTSTNPEHPAGAKRTWFQSMKNKNVGFGAVAGFLLHAFALENNAARKTDFFPFLEPFMLRVTGPENVLSGCYLHLQCSMIKTKEKGNDFTRHDWSPFDYDEARAAGVDLSPPRWGDYMRALPAAPSYGAPSGPPITAPTLSPDGKWRLDPATNAWITNTPPPPPPPPVARQPWEAPGVEVSPDRRWYLISGTQVWNPIPGR